PPKKATSTSWMRKQSQSRPQVSHSRSTRMSLFSCGWHRRGSPCWDQARTGQVQRLRWARYGLNTKRLHNFQRVVVPRQRVSQQASRQWRTRGINTGQGHRGLDRARRLLILEGVIMTAGTQTDSDFAFAGLATPEAEAAQAIDARAAQPD